MNAILDTIASSPLLALVGALVLLTVLLLPIVLRVAGLTGAQIVETLRLTANAFVETVKVFRIIDGTDARAVDENGDKRE